MSSTGRSRWSPAPRPGSDARRPGCSPRPGRAVVVADIDRAGGGGDRRPDRARPGAGRRRWRSTWPTAASVRAMVARRGRRLRPSRHRPQQRRDHGGRCGHHRHGRLGAGSAASTSCSPGCSSCMKHEIPAHARAGQGRRRQHVLGGRPHRLPGPGELRGGQARRDRAHQGRPLSSTSPDGVRINAICPGTARSAGWSTTGWTGAPRPRPRSPRCTRSAASPSPRRSPGPRRGWRRTRPRSCVGVALPVDGGYTVP